MKNKKLLLYVVLISSFFLLCGCDKEKNKTSNSAKETVKNIIESNKNNDFFMIDSTSSYEKDEYIDAALVASKDNVNINIFIINDKEQIDYSLDFYDDTYSKLKTESDTYNIEKKDKYSFIEFTSATKYAYVYSSDNIFVTIDTNIENKDNAINSLKELGYYKEK